MLLVRCKLSTTRHCTRSSPQCRDAVKTIIAVATAASFAVQPNCIHSTPLQNRLHAP